MLVCSTLPIIIRIILNYSLLHYIIIIYQYFLKKVEKSAAVKGIQPKHFVNGVSQYFRDLLSVLHISNDKFICTSDDYHKVIVQNLWMTLVNKGAIYQGFYEGWYSMRDECFYTESELINGKAPTGSDVMWIAQQPSYFFKLSQYEEKLLKHFERNPDFVAPVSRRNEVLKFMQGGLHDLSISRTNFRWGIEVPGDNGHIIYVWVDALASYISSLGYSDGKDFDKYWPAGLHVVGKDILRFHAVYWPAILMAAGIDVPKRIFAHGWWTNDGEKISKSVGNIVDPFDLVKQVCLCYIVNDIYCICNLTSYCNCNDLDMTSMVSTKHDSF